MLSKAICRQCIDGHRRRWYIAEGPEGESWPSPWRKRDDIIWDRMAIVFCPALDNKGVSTNRMPRQCYYAAEQVVSEAEQSNL